MTRDLATRLDTHIRYREAREASANELALLNELAALLAPPEPVSGLTPQQRRLLPLLLEGLSIKACGKAMGLSPETIKNHAHHVYRRYGVHSRAELMARHGKQPTTQEARDV